MQRFGQGSPYLRIKGILTTPEGKAAWNVMQKFPASDVHMYLFGPGGIYQDGYQPGNYFDSAGTQLASTDGSVGLVLDAAGSVSGDLLTGDGYFNSVGPWGYGTGWSFSGSSATKVAGTQANLTSRAGVLVSPLNKTYLLECDLTLTAGGVILYVGGYDGTATITTGGKVRQIIKVANALADDRVYVQGNAAFVGSVDNLVVREVTGIHAMQSTPGYKPTLRKGIVNLLTWSNGLATANWVGSSIAAAQNAVAPDGTTTAHTLTISNAFASFRPTADVTVVPGQTYTYAFVAKRGTATDFKLSFYNFTGGADILPATSVYADIGSDWTVVVRTVTVPAGCTALRIFMLRDSGVTGTVFVDRAGLFAGTLTAAQILAAGGIPLTTTAPASSVAGVNYLEFDGVDDRLDLGGPLFQMADDHCVVVGASVGTVTRHVVSPAGNSSAPYVEVAGILVGGGYAYARWRDNANTTVNLTGNTPVGASTVVVSARKVGNTKQLKINGSLAVAPDTTPLGTTTVPYGAIGQYAAGGDNYTGRIYPVLAIKGTVSDADLAVLEKFVAQLSGVQL